MISKKAGNSTARFPAGPLALSPDPGQQKQRAACVSTSLLRKGPNVNPKVQNLQLQASAAALPPQMHGQAHFRDACFLFPKGCPWKKRESSNPSAKFSPPVLLEEQ